MIFIFHIKKYIIILYTYQINNKIKKGKRLTTIVKKNESIERALKRFKRQVNESNVLNEYRSRTEYVKPSVKKREKLKKAKFEQKLRNRRDKF